MLNKPEGYVSVAAEHPDTNESPSRQSFSAKSKDSPSKWKGWRVTIISGAATAAVVLVTNVSLLAWAKARFGSEDLLRIYTPSHCSQVKTASTVIHLFINILSTLLLAASGSAIHCLSAPTREEVDMAHSQYQWLHLGVVGYRNWRYIKPWRKVIWVILTLTSLPLHLLYNSVVFTDYASRSFVTAYVTSRFLEDSDWKIDANRVANNSIAAPPSNCPRLNGEWRKVCFEYLEIHGWQRLVEDELKQWQLNPDQFHKLGQKECLEAYNQQVISDYRNLIILTSADDVKNQLLYLHYSDAKHRSQATEWVCPHMGTNKGSCEADIMSVAEKWTPFFGDPPAPADVISCRAEPVGDRCALVMSTSLLAAVIFCNAAKVVCLAYLALKSDFAPLVTTGDAVASFLRKPDPFTANGQPMSMRQVQRLSPGERKAAFQSARKPPRDRAKKFWFRAVNLERWIMTLAVCAIGWFGPLAFLIKLTSSDYGTEAQNNFSTWLSNGIMDKLPPGHKIISSGGFISDVLRVNTPHIVVSIVYRLCNLTFTSMVLSAEYIDYAQERKSLRVSAPEGEQRSTYWLQQPYRYSLSLKAVMGLLHWLVSQSIFLVQIREFKGISGDNYVTVTGTGVSGVAVILSFVFSGLLILALVLIGFRKYKGDMPIVSSCSLAISLTCKKFGEDGDMVLEPLMYGGLLNTSAVDGDSEDKTGRFGFSAKAVKVLDEDKVQESRSRSSSTSSTASRDSLISLPHSTPSKESILSILYSVR